MANEATPLTPGKQKRNQRIVGAAAFVIFSTIFGSLFFGRCSPGAQEARAFLRAMPADEILEIRVSPYAVMPLVTRDLVISERAEIEKVAGLLRGATAVSLNHPAARWVGVLRLHTQKRDYGGQVESTTNQGVIVMYASEVEGGWNYGAVRQDALGPVLEELAARAGVRGN